MATPFVACRDQATTPGPPSRGGGEVDYHQPEQPVEVGSGLLQAASRDGSALYVTAAAGAATCGGQASSALYRLAIQGGQREALGSPAPPVAGSLLRGKDGAVAVAGCQSVQVGVETADGHLHDLHPLPTDAGSLVALGWSSEGRSVLAATPAASASGRPSLVRIDVSSGGLTPLFTLAGPVTQAAQLADGAYAVAGDGKVTIYDGNGSVRAVSDGDGFVLAPDGRRLVLWGKALQLLTVGQPEATVLLSAPTGQALGPADFSPDGRAVAFVTTTPGAGAVSVVTLADGRVTGFSAAPGAHPRVLFGSDGSLVAFNLAARGAVGEPTVFAVRFGTR
jgi:hypothetical protein